MAQAQTAFEAPAVDWWVLTPQMILVGAALGLLLLASLAPRALPRGVCTAATIAAAAAAAVTAAVQWSHWRSSPRSTLSDAFVSDGFSLAFTVLVGVGVVMTALVAHSALHRYDMAPPEFAALLLTSAAGAVVMAGANDLIVLFLGLESLSIALYVLIALAGRRASAREAAMKYFVLGAYSSAFFLYGIALVYGSTGSTNLGGIGGFLFGSIRESDYLLLAGVALLLTGLGFKVAAVPFHFWAPDVYEGAPSPVTGYLASIAKAAGFAALARVLYVAVLQQSSAWTPILVALALATLAAGAVLAICQSDVKRMLAYSSISHAGFVLVGLASVPAAGGPLQWSQGEGNAVSSAVLYLIVYSFMALGSFAVLSALSAEQGSRDAGAGGADRTSPHALSRYSGLAHRRPVLALAFAALLLAQAGVPLTAGFVAKLDVIRAAAEARGYVFAAIAMIMAVVSAFAYLRVVLAMYAPDEQVQEVYSVVAARAGRPRWGGLPPAAVVAVALSVAVTLVVGVLPQTLLELSRHATLSIVP